MKRETKNPNRLPFKGKSIVKEYLAAKDLFRNRTWKQVGDKLITLFNGEWLSEDELRDRLPILKQPSLLTNMDNPNKKRNWGI